MRIAKKNWTAAIILLMGLMLPAAVDAQTSPYFIGGPLTVFDFETPVVDSGVLLDAKAVPWQDPRYITINGPPANTTVMALDDMRKQGYQVGKLGYVGGANPTGKPTAAPPGAAIKTSPTQIDQADRNALSVLNRRGVFFLGPIK